MKFLHLSILCCVFVIASCKSSKSTATPAEVEALKQLVKQQDFKIESNWAYPQTTNAMQQVLNSGLMVPGSSSNAINLIGNPNFLKISGDSITSYLPYFGERQMQVNYGGGDSAIQFKGLMEDYEVSEGKNNSYDISFEANHSVNSERFQVFITLYPNSKTVIKLNGTGRFPISYAGEIIEKEPK